MNHPNNGQPPPTVVPVQHVCFSGSPACSGCNPCPECREYVQANVLPSAFLASRMSETLLMLHSIIGALIQNKVDPGQLGVDLSRVFPTLEEQGDAFFAGNLEGWNRMHEGMRTDPAVRNRLQVRTVTADGGTLAATMAPPAGAPPHTPQDSQGESSLSKKASSNPFEEALLEQQRQWELEEEQEKQGFPPKVQQPYPEGEPVFGGKSRGIAISEPTPTLPPKPKPVPITVEEVAASGFSVDDGHPESLRNGSA